MLPTSLISFSSSEVTTFPRLILSFFCAGFFAFITSKCTYTCGTLKVFFFFVCFTIYVSCYAYFLQFVPFFLKSRGKSLLFILLFLFFWLHVKVPGPGIESEVVTWATSCDNARSLTRCDTELPPMCFSLSSLTS